METQIATALSIFDTAFTTSLLWGKNTQPYNNAIQGGSLIVDRTEVPWCFRSTTPPIFQIGLSEAHGNRRP